MKMWTDIKEKLDEKGIQTNQTKLGVIITDLNNQKIYEEEYDFPEKTNMQEKINSLIQKYKINEVLYYGSRNNILPKLLHTSIQSKIFSKNNEVRKEVLAHSLKIDVDYNKLNTPLHDIQMIFKSYCKYLELTEQEKKDIQDFAQFELTKNLIDIHKPKANFVFINSKANSIDNFWLINQENIDQELILINYLTWNKKVFKVTEWQEIINFYEQNIVISIYAFKKLNKISEIIYKHHQDKFYVFESINVARCIMNNNYLPKNILFESKNIFEQNCNIISDIIDRYIKAK